MFLKIAFILFLLFSVQLLYGQETIRPVSWAQKVDTSSFKNLYKVNDSIYRSDQPDSLDLTALNNMGVKSLLNLRRHHMDAQFMGKTDLNLFTVKMNAHHFTDEQIIEALKVLKTSPKPLVVHCLHGSDRTGVVLAMYRLVFQNWTKEQALDEFKNGGYGFHKIFINIPAYIKKVDIEKIRAKVLQ